MRKITIPLLALLAGCFSVQPAAGIENFLLSAYDLDSSGNTELAELETDITVTSNAENFFVLLTIDVANQKTTPNQVFIKFAETGAAVADESATFLLPDASTYRIQINAQYTGGDLGLGAHTWKVYAQGFNVILQTTSSMFIANPITPSGVITSLGGQTGATQTFAYSEVCTPDPAWSSATNIHTFCIPDAGTGINRGLVTDQAQNIYGFKQFSEGMDAQGVGANTVCIGLIAVCNDAEGVVVGDSGTAGAAGTAIGRSSDAGDDAVALGRGAVAAADSVAIAQGAVALAGECVLGSPAKPCTNFCFGKGCVSTAPAAQTLHGTNASGTNIAAAAFNIYGGRSTGNAAAGDIVLGTAAAGASGSSLNAIVNRWKIDAESGALLPMLDDTYDIGSGALRVGNYYGTWAGKAIGEAYGGLGVDMTAEGNGIPYFASGFYDDLQIPSISEPFAPYDIGVDGAQCTRTDNHQINTGPTVPTITCTDHASSAFYGVWESPDGWNEGTVTFEIQMVNENATPSGDIDIDFSCFCRGDGDLIGASWGTAQNISYTFTTQYDQAHDITTAVTCASCSTGAGETVYWRGLVDEPSTTTQMGDVYITGVKLEGVRATLTD
jgi:hypothetical protein